MVQCEAFSSVRFRDGFGQTALHYTLKDLESKARSMSNQLADPSDSSLLPLPIKLSRIREQMQIQEATIVTSKGKLVATANAKRGSFVPEMPTISMLRAVQLEGSLRAYRKSY